MKVCRLCLATGVKFTNLGNPRLKDFIESILRSKGYPKELLEKNNVCVECRALLVKSFNFIQRVVRAQKALYMMKPVTVASLKNLDRRNLNLLPTLSYHRVEIDYFIEEKGSKLERDAHSSKNDILSPLDTKNIPYVNSDGNKYNAEDLVKKEIVEEFAADPISTATTTYITVVASDQFNDGKTENNYTENESGTDHLNTSKKTNSSKRNSTKLLGTVISTNNIVIGARKRKAKFVISNPKRYYDNNKKKDTDDDYEPSESSEESVSSLEYDRYDDNGRRMRNPKDNRVYPMQCDHCNYEIEQRSLHYKHYLYCHSNVEYPYHCKKPFICQFCGVAKSRESVLRDHELLHSNKKTIKCKRCPKMFKNCAILYRHTAYFHRNLVICDYCNKQFRMKSDLRLHIRTHTGEKPFKCHICGEAYAHKGNVGIHIRNVHQKEQNRNAKRQKKRVKHKDDTGGSEVDSDSV